MLNHEHDVRFDWIQIVLIIRFENITRVELDIIWINNVRIGELLGFGTFSLSPPDTIWIFTIWTAVLAQCILLHFRSRCYANVSRCIALILNRNFLHLDMFFPSFIFKCRISWILSMQFIIIKNLNQSIRHQRTKRFSSINTESKNLCFFYEN